MLSEKIFFKVVSMDKKKNYRPITLLNTAYKVLSNVINARLQPYAEDILGQYQCGFRKNRSTIDQIFILRQILEKCSEWCVDTYHMFIDFRTAYDSIKRIELYRAMQELGIPEKLTSLTRMTMASALCRVKIEKHYSLDFNTSAGLRQGDGLACTLFNIALEKIIRDSGVTTTGNIYNRSVQILGYADDVDIVGRTIVDVKEAFINIEVNAGRMGLAVNEEKTKLLFSTTRDSRRSRLGQNLTIDNYNIEVVEEFVYLGTLVGHANNNTSIEVKRRLVLANRCFYGLRRQFSCSTLSRTTKTRIYKTLLLPVITYGSETWSTTRKEEQLLCCFERKVLRKIYGPVCENNVWRKRYNFELYGLYKDANIVAKIKIGRLRWAGHIARADPNNSIRTILDTKPEGQRRPGRPKARWLDGVVSDAADIGVRNWRAAAGDRSNWRRMLVEAKTHPGLSRL